MHIKIVLGSCGSRIRPAEDAKSESGPMTKMMTMQTVMMLLPSKTVHQFNAVHLLAQRASRDPRYV